MIKLKGQKLTFLEEIPSKDETVINEETGMIFTVHEVFLEKYITLKLSEPGYVDGYKLITYDTFCNDYQKVSNSVEDDFSNRIMKQNSDTIKIILKALDIDTEEPIDEDNECSCDKHDALTSWFCRRHGRVFSLK